MNSVVWLNTGLLSAYFHVYKIDIEISTFWSIQEEPGIYKNHLDSVAADYSQQSIELFLQARFPGFFTILAIHSGYMASCPYPSSVAWKPNQSCTHVLISGLDPLHIFDLYSYVRAFNLHFWDISLDTLSAWFSHLAVDSIRSEVIG